jgi:hypothetical protein
MARPSIRLRRKAKDIYTLTQLYQNKKALFFGAFFVGFTGCCKKKYAPMLKKYNCLIYRWLVFSNIMTYSSG